MGQPRPLFHLFSSFQTHITNFATNRYVKNVHPEYGVGIRTQHLKHESPTITTRPGLLPKALGFTKVVVVNYK